MDLKPCPFCGGKAKQVDICATDFSSANAGGSYIICQSCWACSAVMFREKAGLSELWNRRALPHGPRTCETCATGCLPNERVYVNPDAENPCPGWTHRSPQSADVETVREAEKSYCIERVGANLYWGGSPMTGKYKGLDALVSISAAIRFARKEDAEMVRASQGMSSDEYVVTEHQWL